MIPPRWLRALGCLFGSVVVFASACGGDVERVAQGEPGPGAPAIDGGRGDGTAPTVEGGVAAPPSSAFCAGADPRVEINGVVVPVLSIKGKAIAMNCCDAGELTVATGAFQALLHVLWRVTPGSPRSLDVASLAKGSGLELDLGCDPATTSCDSGAEDRYTSGFQGTIEYAPSASGMEASYCLSVAEPAAQPHAVLHAIRLYAPHVASSY